MKHLPILLSAALGLGTLGYAAGAFGPSSAEAAQETQKTSGEKAKDKKGDEASSKITVWVLDAAGKG